MSTRAGQRKDTRLPIPTAIADSVRARILEGKLTSGERISEMSLSKEFGVGHPAVREALILLEKQGLVQRVRNIGTFVTKLDVTDVTSYHRIRVALEGLAASLAARHFRAEDAQQLRDLIGEMHDSALSGDKWMFVKNDLAFHRKIWELSRSPKLAEVLDSIVVPLIVFGFIKIVDLSGFENTAMNAHTRLVGAMEEGPERAQEVMSENLRASLSNYLEHSL